MTNRNTPSPQWIAELTAQLAGAVLLPGQEGYERECTMYNVSADNRPVLVVSATSAADVQAAVVFASTHNLTVVLMRTAGASIVLKKNTLLITTGRQSRHDGETSCGAGKIDPPPRDGAEPAEDFYAGLYRENHPSLVRFATSMARGQQQTGEDVAQETMLRAWRHLDKVPGDRDGQRRWLFTVARRILIDAARHQRTRPPEVALKLVGSAVSPDDPAASAVAGSALKDAFDQLSDGQRRTLRAVCLDELTVQETADLLRIPVGTVKSRLHYARWALRSALLDIAS